MANKNSTYKDLQSLRVNYKNESIEESKLPLDPIILLSTWMDKAIDEKIADANAFSLSTYSTKNGPSSRTVLAKEISTKGLVFYTNYSSRKGRDINENPRVAGTFLWPSLQRQICFSGYAKRTSRSKSAEYFNQRSLESRVSAVISEQSRPLQTKEKLGQAHLKLLGECLQGKKIICPRYWGGIEITISRIEFWQGGEHRLHDRILYSRSGPKWHRCRLYP